MRRKGIYRRFIKRPQDNKHKEYGPYEKYLKRPLDCFIASCTVVVLSPVMGITALLVRRKLGSPVIFMQERPGRDSKVFRLYKFRSMTDEREDNGELLPDQERITQFGRFLRSTSLDELPELINIIKGDMAIVGPRPLLTKYLPYYTEYEARRHEVRPGLTGLAQVNGRNAIRSWEKRFSLDVEYVDRITFVQDVRIVLLTIKKVLSSENVVDPGLQDDFDEYRRKNPENE